MAGRIHPNFGYNGRGRGGGGYGGYHQAAPAYAGSEEWANRAPRHNRGGMDWNAYNAAKESSETVNEYQLSDRHVLRVTTWPDKSNVPQPGVDIRQSWTDKKTGEQKFGKGTRLKPEEWMALTGCVKQVNASIQQVIDRNSEAHGDDADMSAYAPAPKKELKAPAPKKPAPKGASASAPRWVTGDAYSRVSTAAAPIAKAPPKPHAGKGAKLPPLKRAATPTPDVQEELEEGEIPADEAMSEDAEVTR